MQFFATFVAAFLGAMIFGSDARDEHAFITLLIYVTFALFAAWARVA
jgi:hypothetical protein